MSDFSNLKVGDTIWLSSNGSIRIGARELGRRAVTKIGRKWIYCGNERFDKETGKIDGGAYSSPGRAFLSPQDYEDAVALERERQTFYRMLEHARYSGRDLSIDVMSQVRALLKDEGE